jgi:hypothetical protein
MILSASSLKAFSDIRAGPISAREGRMSTQRWTNATFALFV